ncbi:hypothetical protein ABEB36_005527 [Hypothenemus hampei]|uniref:C2H2-type domain-containing protein n=1 Tax=Hypothenemus hampei TaxID=57062 RepID=A0ABD1F2D1_HYPHA
MDNPVHPENCSCNVCFLPYYTPNPQEQQGMHQNQQYYSSSMSNVLYTQQQANLQPDINLYPQFPFDVPSSSDYRPPNIQNQLNLIQDFVDYSDEYTSTGQASTCFPPGDHFAFPVMPSVSTEAIPILESFQQELEQPSTSRGLPGQSTDTEENQVSKKRKMNCPECNKVFNHTGDYKKHMRKHTKEKPFPCSQCGKKFSVTSNLHRHKKSEHSDDRPFQCDYCTKTFKRKDKLDNHKKCCKKKFDRERK